MLIGRKCTGVISITVNQAPQEFLSLIAMSAIKYIAQTARFIVPYLNMFVC